MSAHIVFDHNRCKGCELCVSVCPKRILSLDISIVNVKGYHPVACKDESLCVGCASCGKICPDSVITITKD